MRFVSIPSTTNKSTTGYTASDIVFLLAVQELLQVHFLSALFRFTAVLCRMCYAASYLRRKYMMFIIYAASHWPDMNVDYLDENSSQIWLHSCNIALRTSVLVFLQVTIAVRSFPVNIINVVNNAMKLPVIRVPACGLSFVVDFLDFWQKCELTATKFGIHEMWRRVINCRATEGQKYSCIFGL